MIDHTACSSMSRYGDFKVVKTVLRKCKRSSDPKSEREYSCMRCPWCNAENIETISEHIQKNKHMAIRDHMVVCPAYTGERPSKRAKSHGKGDPNVTIVSIPVAIPTPTAISYPVIQIPNLSNTPNNEDGLDELKRQIDELKRDNNATKANLARTNAILETTNSIVAQHQVWWGDAASALGIAPPLDPPLLVHKIKELRQTRADFYLQQKQTMLMIESSNKLIQQKDIVIADQKRLLEEDKQRLREGTERLKKLEAERDEASAVAQEAQKRANEANRTARVAVEKVHNLQIEIDKVRRSAATLKLKLGEKSS